MRPNVFRFFGVSGSDRGAKGRQARRGRRGFVATEGCVFPHGSPNSLKFGLFLCDRFQLSMQPKLTIIICDSFPQDFCSKSIYKDPFNVNGRIMDR